MTTTLSMAERELRQESRRSVTWRFRLFVALILLCVWFALQIVFTQGSVPPTERGFILFATMAVLVHGFATIAGPLTAADCVSQEKRDGTLGLLFLTDLSPMDIVLGKLASRLTNSLFGILAGVPIVALGILMGGVSGQMIFRSAAAWVDMLFLSLAVSIFTSSVVESERKSMMTTLFILGSSIFLPVVLIIYILIYREATPDWRWIAPIASLSPWSSVAIALSPPIPLPTSLLSGYFWSSIAMHQLIAGLLLVMSGRLLRSTWQNRAGVRAESFRNLREWWLYGNPSSRKRWRVLWLGQNAFSWRALREIRKPLLTWILVVGLIGGFLWGWTKSGNAIFSGEVLLTWIFITFGILKLWVATEASRQISEDRPHGILELILSTPISISEIARGQFIALRMQFLGPALLACGLHGLLWLLANSVNSLQFIFFLTMPFIFWADLWALYWTGLWAALNRPGTNQALLFNVFILLMMPWIAVLITAIAGAFLHEWYRHPYWGAFVQWIPWDGLDIRDTTFFTIAAVASLFWSLWVGGRMRRAFLSEARKTAAEGPLKKGSRQTATAPATCSPA